MKQTVTIIPNPSTITPSIHSTTVKQKTTTSPSVCKICGDPAQYTYFGAIVCQSCKIFFRRNAKKVQSISFKCNYHYHCQIDINSRQTCLSYRLDKCFSIGMNDQLIRASRTKQTEKKKSTTNSIDLIRLDERNSLQQIPTLNLL